MAFAEKRNWVYLVVTVMAALTYTAIILVRARQGISLAELPYAWPLLGSIGATIVATIVGSILTAIVAASRGERRFEPDERDAAIERRADGIGYNVFSVGILAVLALTMAEAAHFWIGNAIYLAFVVATLVSVAVKLVAYRRGIPSW